MQDNANWYKLALVKQFRGIKSQDFEALVKGHPSRKCIKDGKYFREKKRVLQREKGQREEKSFRGMKRLLARWKRH